jgi:hypothetical protein
MPVDQAGRVEREQARVVGVSRSNRESYGHFEYEESERGDLRHQRRGTQKRMDEGSERK